MTLTSRKRRGLCTLLIVGLPPVILAGARRLGGVSALEDDLIYYLPIRAFIGESIRAGTLPLWNPYVALGTSVGADPQSGLWYPMTLLFAVLPPLWAYSLTICLHFALAGGGMYRFLRAIGRDWRAALLGAIAFEFCGFVVAHRAHLTILEATAWLPWMLYAWHRWAVTGRGAYFIFAVSCLGVQLLAQHIQITIIGGAILTAYVVAILWRLRRSLLWEYPAGLALGGMIGAVQLLPTFAAFARSGRSAPAYYLFVENSYAPTSFFMWLFPFVFGNRTPNFYGQPWWGWSHLCEQATYASIGVLVLAIASAALWRRDRQVRFWWLLMVASIVVALGQFTPLSRALFHIPVLRSLRVPARWMLGFDMGMVVLAAASLDALIRGDVDCERMRRWLRVAVTRVLPGAAAACLLCMVVAREASRELFSDDIAAHVAEAIRPSNPAIWVPLGLMLLTAAALLRLGRSARAEPGNEGSPGARPLAFALLFFVVVIDLATFAAFVDVDVHEYSGWQSVVDPPPLARKLALLETGSSATGPAATRAVGERLWVPRMCADYSRPIEVLWPQTNVLHRVPVLNGYGPMWPVENRALLHFMPWGASQSALGLLYNPRLLQSLGVRWLAARSEQERELMALALAGPAADALPAMEVQGPVVLHGSEWRMPVSIPEPGVYAIEFQASAGPRDRDRWYLWLTAAADDTIGDVLWYEPTDFVIGSRTMRGFFICREAAPSASVRAYGEPWCNVMISDLRFGRIAAWPPGPPEGGPYALVSDLPDGTMLYELRGSQARYKWAASDVTAENVIDAIRTLRFASQDAGLPGNVVITGPPAQTGAETGVVEAVSEELNRIVLDVSSERPGTLVFNDTYDPGWRATIDGVPAEIVRANVVVQGVRVPSGRHRVEFCYWPDGLSLGMYVSALTIIALAGLGAVNRQRRPTYREASSRVGVGDAGPREGSGQGRPG